MPASRLWVLIQLCAFCIGAKKKGQRWNRTHYLSLTTEEPRSSFFCLHATVTLWLGQSSGRTCLSFFSDLATWWTEGQWVTAELEVQQKSDGLVKVELSRLDMLAAHGHVLLPPPPPPQASDGRSPSHGPVFELGQV